MQSTIMVRLGSIAMFVALLIGASSAIVLGTNEAAACTVTVNGCVGGSGPGDIVRPILYTHLDPSASASAALGALNGVVYDPPPLPPQVSETAVEYPVMLALIIVVCIGAIPAAVLGG